MLDRLAVGDRTNTFALTLRDADVADLAMATMMQPELAVAMDFEKANEAVRHMVVSNRMACRPSTLRLFRSCVTTRFAARLVSCLCLQHLDQVASIGMLGHHDIGPVHRSYHAALHCNTHAADANHSCIRCLSASRH